MSATLPISMLGKEPTFAQQPDVPPMSVPHLESKLIYKDNDHIVRMQKLENGKVRLYIHAVKCGHELQPSGYWLGSNTLTFSPVAVSEN